MTATLLPPNATTLSLALEAVLAADARLAGIDGITGAKLDVAPSYVPWLLWEYGLGELLPYLPDPRAAIRDGVAWQRLRGTPQGLATALGWIGFDAAATEEAGAGPRFGELQIDPGAVPSREEARRIVGVASLALPARAHLVRLYHGYDLRPLVASGTVGLDEGLLSDDSGVDLDGVRQSYGLFHRAGIAADVPAEVAAGTTSRWGGTAVYLDRPILDHWAFGDDVVFNHPVLGSELVTLATAGLPRFVGLIGEPLSVPRAALVASESALGDVNAILGAWGTIEKGEPLIASGTAALSDYELTATRTRFDEVFAETTRSAVTVTPAPAPALGRTMTHAAIAASLPQDTVLDGEPVERVNHPAAGHGLAAGTGGPYDAPWPSAPWPDQAWGTAAWSSARKETMAPSALGGLDLADQAGASQSAVVSLVAELGASVSGLIWSGAVILPEELPFWEIVPWPGTPWDDRIWAGGGGFGGWAAQLINHPRRSLSTAYEPLWPDAAWSAHRWSDPVVSVAVTSTGA